MLSGEVMLQAGRSLWQSMLQSEAESYGAGRFWSRMVDCPPDAAIKQLVPYYTGMLHKAWDLDPWLVFHHMGFVTDEEQARGLYLVLMSVQGHGIGLEDDHGVKLEAVRGKFHRDLTAAPYYDEMWEMQDLATISVQGWLGEQGWSHSCLPVVSDEDFLWNQEVRVRGDLSGGDVCGSAVVTGRVPDASTGNYKLVVLMDDDTGRGGEYFAVFRSEVSLKKKRAKQVPVVFTSPVGPAFTAAVGSRLRHISIRNQG